MSPSQSTFNHRKELQWLYNIQGYTPTSPRLEYCHHGNCYYDVIRVYDITQVELIFLLRSNVIIFCQLDMQTVVSSASDSLLWPWTVLLACQGKQHMDRSHLTCSQCNHITHTECVKQPVISTIAAIILRHYTIKTCCLHCIILTLVPAQKQCQHLYLAWGK